MKDTEKARIILDYITDSIPCRELSFNEFEIVVNRAIIKALEDIKLMEKPN